MNQSSNRTSLDTDTRWPAHQALNTRHREANTRTSSTTSARPNIKHPSDQPTEGHGSRMQNKHITHNIGKTPGHSNINWEQNNPREGKSLRMEAPHTPHHRTGLSQAYSNISVSNTNTPMVPTNIPSTHTRLEASSNPSASCNHGDQHTDIVPVIRRTSKQLGNQQGHNRPQEGTTHHMRNPQIPHHWIHPIQSRPGTSGGNSNGQIIPIVPHPCVLFCPPTTGPSQPPQSPALIGQRSRALSPDWLPAVHLYSLHSSTPCDAGCNI